MANLTVVTPALFSPDQVKRIEERLDGPIGNIYLAANMASLVRDARKEDDIELASVLGHMSKMLLKVAESIADTEIIPYAERAKAVTT